MKSTRLWVGIGTAIAAVLFVATFVHATLYSPEIEVAIPNASTTPGQLVPKEDQPSRLQIPALSIDANVQDVGVKPDGSMGTPNNFTDVAWYKYGAAPGYRGSAVIDGHVDNGLSLAGVFKHLGDLKVGESIYVITNGGEKLRFLVTDIESYPYKSVPTEKIFNAQDAAAHLVLITCEGSWVKAEKTYDQRLVVYSVLVR
jgi:LPXTG-site transpeptidase (sortase) family protein